jgi:2,3-bisphosphoglycerate-dependent phosphoglycerate mutase
MTSMTAPYTLILLRHGQSEWNKTNQFTGWVDVRLTEQGRGEAARGGELLKESGILPDVLHTSLLSRAIQTANIALDAADRLWIPVKRSWRLNERHYGASRARTRRRPSRSSATSSSCCGAARSTCRRPARRRRRVQPGERPALRRHRRRGARTESLKIVIDRLLPYWESRSSPTSRAARPCSSRRTATRCAAS